MTWKEYIKTTVRKLLTNSPWSGNYTSWQDALQRCTGYDSPNILKKVEEAILKVKRGEAAYERDSVLFDTVEYSWPLLATLMFIANKQNSPLKVIDFGGSLGSSYFQNRNFLSHLGYVEWNVVEQPSFVTAGRQSVQDEHLRFFYSLDEYINNHEKPDALLLSCTLPYVEKPYELLHMLMSYDIPYIIIDNTYFNYQEYDRICIQQVPGEIYQASYPAWFLAFSKVKQVIEEKYNIISEHTNDTVIFLDGRKVQYQGLFASLKP